MAADVALVKGETTKVDLLSPTERCCRFEANQQLATKLPL